LKFNLTKESTWVLSHIMVKNHNQLFSKKLTKKEC